VITTIEDTFLAKRSRVACLTFDGWLALQQRLANFYSRFTARWDDLERESLPDWNEAKHDEEVASAAMAEPLSEGRRPDC
jgi:hypothetical protein